MINQKPAAKEPLFQCEACGFHYADKELAERCEAWCRERYSCNTEITQFAVESRE